MNKQNETEILYSIGNFKRRKCSMINPETMSKFKDCSLDSPCKKRRNECVQTYCVLN